MGKTNDKTLFQEMPHQKTMTSSKAFAENMSLIVQFQSGHTTLNTRDSQRLQSKCLQVIYGSCPFGRAP